MNAFQKPESGNKFGVLALIPGLDAPHLLLKTDSQGSFTLEHGILSWVEK